MLGRWTPCFGGLVFVLLVALTDSGAALAQTTDEAGHKLNTEVARLYQAGMYAEAISIAQRELNMPGLVHPGRAASLNELEALDQRQGRLRPSAA